MMMSLLNASGHLALLHLLRAAATVHTQTLLSARRLKGLPLFLHSLRAERPAHRVTGRLRGNRLHAECGLEVLATPATVRAFESSDGAGLEGGWVAGRLGRGESARA